MINLTKKKQTNEFEVSSKFSLKIRTIDKVRSKTFPHLWLTILPFQFSINEERIVKDLEIYKQAGRLV